MGFGALRFGFILNAVRRAVVIASGILSMVRITEAGDRRITEAGDRRITEGA